MEASNVSARVDRQETTTKYTYRPLNNKTVLLFFSRSGVRLMTDVWIPSRIPGKELTYEYTCPATTRLFTPAVWRKDQSSVGSPTGRFITGARQGMSRAKGDFRREDGRTSNVKRQSIPCCGVPEDPSRKRSYLPPALKPSNF